jgi:hypothetical protein
MSTMTDLQIVLNSCAASLSPQHKRFKKLLRQVEKNREVLASWRENAPAFRQRYGEALAPLHKTYTQLRREWVFALDGALKQSGWTRAERALLEELLRESAGELLSVDESDEAIKALFDRHSKEGFEARKRQELEMMKAMTEQVLGLDLGEDEDIVDEAKLHERIAEHMHSEAQAHEELHSRRRQSAAQKRKEAETRLATQSLREIYRKLVSNLHPDREGDPERRTVKTELMQKVNEAYEKSDLLTLLEIQLQIEQIDADHVAKASAQRVQHYNRVLAEQLEELKTEIEAAEAEFCLEFGLGLEDAVKPNKLGTLLHERVALLRSEISAQQSSLRILPIRAEAKRWLQRERRARQEAFLQGDFF